MDIKDLVKKIIFFVYDKIFGIEPGPIALNSIKNLGYIFFGLVIAKFLSLFFQIYAGRVLGVVEYGRFTLVFAISQFFYIPMLAGISAGMVKYLAEERDKEEKRAIISTAITLIFGFIVLFSLVFYALSSQIASITSATREYVIAAIFVAVFYALWVLSKKIAQGLYEMKRISLIEIVWAFASASGIVVLIYYYSKSFISPILALILAYGISSLIILPTFKRYFGLKIDGKWARILLSYAIFSLSIGISGVVTENINKILLNVFLSLKEVGLYQAYYFSSFGATYLFVTGFSTVYFPEFSRYENKVVLFDKVNRFMRIAPILYISIVSVSVLMLLLYGSEFPLIVPLVLIFALAATFTFVYSLYSWFAAAHGIEGIKVVAISTLIISVLNISLSYSLIPIFGLYGAVFSSIVSYTAGLSSMYIGIKKILK